MTNKPMLSVEREIIEDALAAVSSSNDSNWSSRLKEKLRALLDAPVEEFNPEGWSIDHSAGRPILMHNNCSVIEAEQAYGLLELIHAAQHRGEIDLTPERLAHAENVIEQQNSVIASLRAELVESYRIDSKHPGEPVAWAHEDGLAGLSVAAKTTWPSFVSISSHKSNHDGISVALYREQPALAALPITDEQILESMRPSIANADGGYVTDTAPQDVIAAGRALLAEVARLNGVKP